MSLWWRISADCYENTEQVKLAQDSKVMNGIQREMVDMNLGECWTISQMEDVGKMFRELHRVHGGKGIEMQLESR